MSEPAEPHLHAVPPPPDNPSTGERPPPQDIPAEQAVIGALLLNPAELATVATHLTPADFYRDAHELIYRAIVDLHHQATPADVITVSAELARRGDLARAGGPAYLHTLLELVPSVAAAGYYAQIVAQRAALRRVIADSTKLVQKAYAAEGADPQALHQLLTDTRAWITDTLEDTPGQANADPRLIPGGTFLFDGGDLVEALWGAGDDVLWQAGEALLIAGGQGVGKTTIAQQIALARLGVRPPELLGLPIAPAPRCLYLAMDRPQQARRSLRRMVTPDDRALLDGALTIWKGPPPGRIVEDPTVLLQLAHQAGLGPGDFVVIDSVKDMAVGVASDEVGAAVNIALQQLIAHDIDVLALHHNRKKGGDRTDKGAPHDPDIDDVYGSTFVTAGIGSVVILVGSPGDPIVRMHHVKQPIGEVGPYQLKHHADTGTTEVFHSIDILDAVLGTGTHGMSAKALATMLFPKTDDIANTSNEVEKARRRLDKLTSEGLLIRREPPSDGKRAGGRGLLATYVAAYSRSGEMLA